MKQFNAHRGIVLTTGVMQIFVRVVGGQTHALNVHRLDTGLHIKLHLQVLYGGSMRAMLVHLAHLCQETHQSASIAHAAGAVRHPCISAASFLRREGAG